MKYYFVTFLFFLISIKILSQGKPSHVSTSKVEISDYDENNYRKFDKKAGRRVGAHKPKVIISERVDFVLDYSYSNTFLIVISEDAPLQVMAVKAEISDKVGYTKWHAYNNKTNKPWSKYFIYLNANNSEIIFDSPNGIYKYFGNSNDKICKSKLTHEVMSSTVKLGIRDVNVKAIKAHYRAHLKENNEACEAIFYATKHNLKIPTNYKNIQLVLEEKKKREEVFEKTNDTADLYVIINKKLLK